MAYFSNLPLEAEPQTRRLYPVGEERPNPNRRWNHFTRKHPTKMYDESPKKNVSFSNSWMHLCRTGPRPIERKKQDIRARAQYNRSYELEIASIWAPHLMHTADAYVFLVNRKHVNLADKPKTWIWLINRKQCTRASVYPPMGTQIIVACVNNVQCRHIHQYRAWCCR